MADQEYEVEIDVVDDNPPNYVGDDTSAETAEQKAERQAKAEQDQDGGKDETPSKRRGRLRDRVDELTRKYRTEERLREQKERELEQIQQQFTSTQSQFQQNQRQSAKFVQNTLSKHEKLLQANLKYARDRGDTDTENRLSDELVEVRTQLNQLKAAYPEDTDQGQAPTRTQAQEQGQQVQQEAQPQGQQPQITEAGRDWIDANSFLREHKNVHTIIANHEAILRSQGEDPAKLEFYQKLNKRIAQDVPKDIADRLRISMNDDLDDDDDDDTGEDDQKPAAKKPASGMADGGRSTAQAPKGKQKVKLTQDEVAYCTRMGIDKQAYAKEKAMTTTRQNENGYTPIV